MELWIPITIAAAFLQNLRTTVQKHLKNVMGTTGATFVRFGFGVPVAFFYWFILIYAFQYEVPSVSGYFLFWVVIAGIAQIGATFLLIYVFSFRNFTVGNAYSRTEPMQTAIFATLLFGESFSAAAVISIFIAVVGVMLISVARTKITLWSLISSLFTRTALIGLSAGTLFGLTAVSFQQAARSVGSDYFIMQASTTLVVAITFQTLIMLMYMFARDRGEIARIARAWKPAALVGLFGATATFGWFTAFTLQQAAIVKVLAQVEMLFSFASSIFIFKETINRLEIWGCVLIVCSIILLTLLA